ncbi:MAG: FAD-linked oxidase C-terminal domain-containing protein [Candidatus Brocadiales bacterium]
MLKSKQQTLDQAVLDELIRAVGKEHVHTNVEQLVCYSYDATATRQRAMPDVVVKASTTEEVAAVVKVADKNNIPISPCGARSGLSGGSIPLYGGIALDTTRMDRILEINAQDMIATVEPGVVTKRFQDEAARHKLFYPPDPGSAEFSTLGGNIAECSGGMAGIKYGVTRDYVLSLEVVLPDGRVINTGKKTWRTVAGYDLTRLFVGSEGTLGVFTKITVKLIPLPAKVETVLAYFSSAGNAVDAADGIILDQGVIPKTLEFVDSICIDSVRGYGGIDIPKEAKAMLLVDVDGDPQIVKRERLRVEEACKKNNAFQIVIAEDVEKRNALWQVRRVISPALFKVAGKKLNEDVCVPRSKIKEVTEEAYSLAREYSIDTACFGHIGDGNVHINFLYGEGDEQQAKVDKMLDRVMEKVIALGGTITGEHGIGTAKAKHLPWEIPRDELELMKSLKKLIDPKNIMNPGKIFVS